MSSFTKQSSALSPRDFRKQPGTTGLFAKPLRDSIAKATQPAFAKRGSIHIKILTEWERIAGPHLAPLCTPVKVSFPRGSKQDGTLTLSVDGGHATLVQHQQNLLLEALAIYFGYRAITRIKLDQAHHTKLPESKLTRNKQLPKLHELPHNLDDLPDGEVKDALTQLAKTMLQS
jgi:hypothetical protein